MEGFKFKTAGIALATSFFTGGEEGLRNYLIRAMKRCVEIVAERAKENCPVLTGALRASIYSTVEQVTKDIIKGEIIAGGPEAGYGYFVHEGTSKRAPNPFLTKALNDSLGEIDALINRALKDFTKTGKVTKR